MASRDITLCGSLSKWTSPLGAAMHNAAYAALGLDWHYVPFGIDKLEPAVAAIRALGIRGCGISMPFKRAIMPLLDALDPMAERIGAVNTVVNHAGHLVGHNTDWHGAVKAIEERWKLDGADVLLLGAGGAGRAVAVGLIESGAALRIANRTDSTAEALANDLGAGAVPWVERGAQGFDILVNATSSGMTDVDPSSPFPREALHDGAVVMDIVYKPLETQLLRDARERELITIHGGRMLLHQAARQHELYSGRPAPLDAMDAALLAAIG